ncbi:hypothetical protein CJ030_MR3G026438 [Morella rubra]|uniref:Pectinesterase inhibitor domain-containing protein n=1 Tax=Morella rubra TaxID=262757 RepID=A0A6A1W494_9ROSI|nr:hypothetical protein CJ030_MR3G026438 [Morella rubra]
MVNLSNLDKTGKLAKAHSFAVGALPVFTSTSESDPRRSTANLTGLARIALELAEAKANETVGEAYKLVSSAPSYEVWAARTACYSSWNTTLYGIKTVASSALQILMRRSTATHKNI